MRGDAMFALITGGSGSGKSEYAENLAVMLSKETAPTWRSQLSITPVLWI